MGGTFSVAGCRNASCYRLISAPPSSSEAWQSQPCVVLFTVKMRSWAYLPETKKNRAAENTGILDGQPDLDLKRSVSSLPHDTVQQ